MTTIKQKIIKSRKRKRAKSESKIRGTIKSIRKKGTTSIEEVNHILRGYDSIVEKLNAVGANISLIE